MKIKILSWNIWCGAYLDEVLEFLKNADADIIALQEISKDDKGNLAEIIANKLDYKYADAIDMNMPVKFLQGYDQNDTRVIKFGTAILTKHAIINSEIVELSKEDKRSATKVQIKIGENILNVFSIHLKHSHQQQLDLQDLQADNLFKLAPKENTIIMGDFNALPESSVIQKMNINLQNTEKDFNTPTWSVYEKGCSTCLIKDIKYKLDYIFTTKDIKVDSFEVYDLKASDHLPVSAIIEI